MNFRSLLIVPSIAFLTSMVTFSLSMAGKILPIVEVENSNFGILTPDLFYLDTLGLNDNADPIFGPQNVITNEADAVWDVHAADLDQDGDQDVLAAIANSNLIAWYENLGAGMFSDLVVIDDQVIFPKAVFAADLDGDDDIDVIAATHTDDKVIVYENMGNGQFGIGQILTNSLQQAWTVHADDLDGDGDMDVLAGFGSDVVAWFENDGEGNFGSIQEIAVGMGNIISVYSVDLDGDNDIDVLSASLTNNLLTLHMNDGDQDFSNQVTLSTDFNGPQSVIAGDLDNDGDPDVVTASMGDNRLAWYENLGAGTFSNQKVISEQALQPRDVQLADLDNDGDLDLICAAHAMDAVVWYENLGLGYFSYPKVITFDAENARAIYPIDVDGDGDIEIVSASDFDDKLAWYDNMQEFNCTDSEACNYDPIATEDDGSCCNAICGCNDPLSINFNSTSTCDDGSCLYRLDGYVFYDENESNSWDQEEYALANQIVILHPLEWMAHTNSLGMFSFIEVPSGEYWLEYVTTASFPHVISEHPQWHGVFFNCPQESIELGVSDEDEQYELSVSVLPQFIGYPCNDYVGHNIDFQNGGTKPLAGIIELAFDTLFQGLQVVTPIDSIVDNSVFMSFENQLPGQIFHSDVDLLTPSVEYLGDSLWILAKVYGYNDGEFVAYGESYFNQIINCSYDPNDKQTIPQGYNDEHFVEEGVQLEYVIRFQNTGSAPATNVLITDTISEHLDLSSFQLLANSHSVNTTVYPDERLIEFLFENILLPDSTSNEPASHGMVAFGIELDLLAQPGTVINNSASIFFDINEPIFTNTTWHTVFDCPGSMGVVEGNNSPYCAGDTVALINSQNHVESYIWTVMDYQGSESNFSFVAHESVIVDHMASNPICQVESMVEIEVFPSQDISIQVDGNVLTSSFGFFYQWLLNGEEILNATNQILEAETSGVYTVIVTDENGCEHTSSEVEVITSVFESQLNQTSVFPTLSNGVVTIKSPFNGRIDVQIFNVHGELIITKVLVDHSERILNLSHVAPGIYLIQLQVENGDVYQQKIVLI